MKALIRQMTNNEIQVQCPKCNHDSVYARNSTDEGKCVKNCQVCGEKLEFEVNKEEMFK